MRLLFVHEVNYREKVVFEMHDFPELLSLADHDVTFIDFGEGGTRSGLRRWFDWRTETAVVRDRAHSGAEVRVITPGRLLPPPLDRLLASLTQVPVLIRTLKSEPFDCVVLYAVPTNGWQALIVAQRLGVPVLFRALDISHRLRPTVFASLIERAERFIYRRADAVSANNHALARYIVENGGNPDTISVDYPVLDLERFSPGPSRRNCSLATVSMIPPRSFSSWAPSTGSPGSIGFSDPSFRCWNAGRRRGLCSSAVERQRPSFAGWSRNSVSAIRSSSPDGSTTTFQPLQQGLSRASAHRSARGLGSQPVLARTLTIGVGAVCAVGTLLTAWWFVGLDDLMNHDGLLSHHVPPRAGRFHAHRGLSWLGRRPSSFAFVQRIALHRGISSCCWCPRLRCRRGERERARTPASSR